MNGEGTVYPSDLVGLLQGGTPCRQCSYNLRGLSYEGRCPECGTPVAMSVCEDLLRFSQPQWLLTLRRGLTLLIVSAILSFVLTMVTSRAIRPMRSIPPIYRLIALQIPIVAEAIGGGWMLTKPDPSGLGEQQYGASRRVARTTYILALVQPLLYLSQVSRSLPPNFSILFEITDFLFRIISVMGIVAVLHYLSRLALRFPDQRLSDRAKFLRNALGWTQGVFLVHLIVIDFAFRSRPLNGIVACGLILLLLLLLFFYGMQLLMYWRFANRLTQAAKASEPLWRENPIGSEPA